MTKSALFVGLITLDLIYLSQSPPQNNQKLVATDHTVAAGGPATNASVTFSYLGNTSKILGVLGSHPMTQLIDTDIKNYQVEIIDLDASKQTSPPVSSIIVTQSTGERAVISINAVKTQANISSIPINILENIDIVLIDGHQMAVSKAIVQEARNQNIPVVIDGGSWKPGFEEILPYVDYAICSANFYPPNCKNQADVLNYLQVLKIPHIAITQGEKPIEYLNYEQRGLINVPKISTVDTLGAGDIFHGAFCHYILQSNFLDALASASNIAAEACKYFGTRRWMES
ncbi:sugar kinase [Sphaerospermopsis aphanizomenoides BCCUSP55]|uniref:sugar kinase n=1 Tax=Sphaerospermopsis aphanizomenoides TaxID=459663 RepID=UPI000B31B7FC|nr:sugar kinase [Sphaerospermopsis aphanizomenoides]MBK1986139.1 sugar kinase [Sphaerospermopsis aphanizomenoides BCCUSP55]